MNEIKLIKQMKAGKLEVKVYDTRQSMGKAAAFEADAKIGKLLEHKAEVNIIFAAAPSQNEFLAALAGNMEIDWTRINAFHLDEYIGLDPDAPQGFGNFLRERLFGRLPFKSINYINGNVPGNERDLNQECERYSKLLAANPPDLVCMGIGENGHIAFNDPHVARFDDRELVKAVELDKKCRMQQVNDGCFSSLDRVPLHALTLTIPAIMSGREILCMVPGKSKADALFSTVTGEITEACPASILKTHRNAILYADLDSAARIL